MPDPRYPRHPSTKAFPRYIVGLLTVSVSPNAMASHHAELADLAQSMASFVQPSFPCASINTSHQ